MFTIRPAAVLLWNCVAVVLLVVVLLGASSGHGKQLEHQLHTESKDVNPVVRRRPLSASPTCAPAPPASEGSTNAGRPPPKQGCRAQMLTNHFYTDTHLFSR